EKLRAGIVGMLGRETRDLIFEKNETGGIFKELRIRIDLQSGLGNPGGSLLSLSRLHAGLEEQFACALRLSSIEILPPREIPGSALRKRIARNTPALEMLAP